jgi:hypothetical protein
VHGLDIGNRSQYPSTLRVDDDDLAVAQVCNEEQVAARIERLIVQTRRVTRQLNVGDRFEWQR